MINGNEMKNNIEYELENIEDIKIHILENEIKLECMTLDLFFDEIKENIKDYYKFLRWETGNRTYIVEKNYFKVIFPMPATTDLKNIKSSLKYNIFETYVDMCSFSRSYGVYQEAEGGVLL